MDENEKKIGFFTILLMLGVAVVIDIVQFILALFVVGLVINRFISIFAFMLFFLWFLLNDVSFLSGKRWLSRTISFFGSAGGELVPVVGALPLWTIGIYLTIRSANSEGKSINIEE